MASQEIETILEAVARDTSLNPLESLVSCALLEGNLNHEKERIVEKKKEMECKIEPHPPSNLEPEGTQLDKLLDNEQYLAVFSPKDILTPFSPMMFDFSTTPLINMDLAVNQTGGASFEINATNLSAGSELLTDSIGAVDAMTLVQDVAAFSAEEPKEFAYDAHSYEPSNMPPVDQHYQQPFPSWLNSPMDMSMEMYGTPYLGTTPMGNFSYFLVS